MADFCWTVPKVRRSDGTLVNSKLFRELDKYTMHNRPNTLKLWGITRNKDFINNVLPHLKVDENGEPTLQSLLDETDIADAITDESTLTKLNREVGHYESKSNQVRKVENTEANRAKLVDKAIDFNNRSPYKDKFVANVNTVAGPSNHKNGDVVIEVERRTEKSSEQAANMEVNRKLNNSIREILGAHGVTIGALTELEERMGINGVTDFDKARRAADGYMELIRLAHGIRGEQALPEEFAHSVIEAMTDNPLRDRLLRLLQTEGMVEDILGDEYETYKAMYQGDENRLLKEAAGKLLYRHFMQAAPESMANKPYKNILQRFIDAVKKFFRQFSTSEFERAKAEADKGFGVLAKNILAGKTELNFDNISETGQLYQALDERTERLDKLLRKLMDSEAKKVFMTERVNRSSKDDTRRVFIGRLEEKLVNLEHVVGINMYIMNAIDELKAAEKEIEDLKKTNSSSISKRAKAFRNIKHKIYSFFDTVDDIREAMMDEEQYIDNRFNASIRASLTEMQELLNRLNIKYGKSYLPDFIEFMKPFMGEVIVIPFGRNRNTVIKLEDLVLRAEKDISIVDRWLNSMADSSDWMLKGFDQVVKVSKDRARLSTIEDMKQLQAAGIRLEQAGVRDTEWMYERDEKGNLTGNFISALNWGEYARRRREKAEELRKKYGDEPEGEDAEALNNEMRTWLEANREAIDDEGGWQPKASIYTNAKFGQLSKPQQDFYNAVMDMKRKLDSYLPTYVTKLNHAPRIRKDLIERVRQSEDVKSGVTQIWESVKDAFIRRCDDTDFGDRTTVKDFEGREVQQLPIYYTRMRKGESFNDLSTDVVSTMIAYAAMANDYNEMSQVIDILEIGRDLMRQREIGQTRGDLSLVEKFKAAGRAVESGLHIKGDESRFMGRLNDWFSMVVYGRYIKDEGDLFGSPLDIAKTADTINFISSLNTIAMSLLTGISNVETGKVMMRIESFGKEFFSETDTLWADKTYASSMPAYVAEVGKRVHTSKLALWMERFDVLQDYDKDINDTNFNRKTRFSKLCSSRLAFLNQNAGEHWMQTRTSLALAHAFKMKGPDGRICSLWDAMEVQYLDPSNHDLGARLVVKQGYTKADGTELTEKDLYEFTRRSAGVNDRMHGIYNKIDRSAIQANAAGRMGMLYRKWIVPSLNRRFEGVKYNYDLKAWTEGYYRTTGRFLKEMAQDLKAGKFAIMSQWKNLTDTEKANIRRAVTEIGHLILVYSVMQLLMSLKKGDDGKKRPWWFNELYYQVCRLYTEIGALTPGFQMISEGIKIVKSPVASADTMDRMLSIVKLLDFRNYEMFYGEGALVKQGPFKGRNKATKIFLESPFIPMGRTFIRNMYPELSAQYFNQ